MEIKALPIHNSYWVIPGRFLAGEHPGKYNDADTRQKLHWLMGNGINFILDLTQNLGSGVDYLACITATAKLFNQQVIYKRLPLQDFGTPSEVRMVKILDCIDSALSAGNKIYLHCYAGMGRTGMVVGCYLARHGASSKEALKKIMELRRGMPNEKWQSPETPDQRRMVTEWIKGQ